MKKVLLISGKQGSGKSTLVTELRKHKRVAIIKFADPLYEMHEFILNKMQTWTGKTRVVKDGKLLQVLGTEWGRNHIGENIWVDIAKHRVAQLQGATLADIIAFDDCRFENEFGAFPEALKIRLECPEAVRKHRMTHGWRDMTNHPSETGLDKFSADAKFDLVFDTSISSAQDMVPIILSSLDMGVLPHGTSLQKPK